MQLAQRAIKQAGSLLSTTASVMILHECIKYIQFAGEMSLLHHLQPVTLRILHDSR